MNARYNSLFLKETLGHFLPLPPLLCWGETLASGTLPGLLILSTLPSQCQKPGGLRLVLCAGKQCGELGYLGAHLPFTIP